MSPDLPLAVDSAARDAVDPRSTGVRFAVAVSVTRDLGRGREAIDAWARQSYPAGDFEILAMADSRRTHDPGKKAALRNVDSWIEHASSNERQLFDVAARRARAQILVFTEAHCVPEPDFLEQMDRFLASGDYAAACCRSVGICTNWISRASCRTFDRELADRVRRGHWNLVIIHGFAVRRDVYLTVGGYAYAYGQFADDELGLRLHRSGHRVGYAENARVLHYYYPRLAEPIAEARSAAAGECAYRFAPNTGGAEAPVGMPDEWRAARESPRDHRRIFGALAGQLWRTPGDRALRSATRRAFRDRFRASRTPPRLRFAAAWLRCHLWRFHGRLMDRAISDLWLRAMEVARLDGVRARNGGGERDCDGAVCGVGRRPIERLADRSLVGFYSLEIHAERVFRWSRPNSAVRLALEPRRYRIEIESGIRELPPNGLRVFFNSTPLPPTAVVVDGDRIAVSVPEDTFERRSYQLLIIACDPLPPPVDGRVEPRDLGLPIFALQVSSID